MGHPVQINFNFQGEAIPAATYEVEFDNALDDKFLDSEDEPQPLLRMKNIRKDVFSYLKAVLEESRIFLPMKLPEDTFTTQQPVVTIPEASYSASQTLATFHQQALLQPQMHPQIEQFQIQPQIGMVSNKIKILTQNFNSKISYFS